jgi:DNA repair protein REV1
MCVQGVHTCDDVLRADMSRLRTAIGPKHAVTLRANAAGHDDRTWEPRPARKSVGAQSSWGVRFETSTEALAFAQQLSMEVAARLAKQRLKGAQISLKLWRAVQGAPAAMRKGTMGHGVCDHLSRSITLPSSTGDGEVIAAEVASGACTLRNPHLSPLTPHAARRTPLTSHLSPLTSHLSPLTVPVAACNAGAGV